MVFYTYVMRNTQKGKRYVGHTKNLLMRMEQHNAGKCKSTKAYRPWNLVYQEKFRSRSRAVMRERYFKNGGGRKFLQTLISL